MTTYSHFQITCLSRCCRIRLLSFARLDCEHARTCVRAAPRVARVCAPLTVHAGEIWERVGCAGGGAYCALVLLKRDFFFSRHSCLSALKPRSHFLFNILWKSNRPRARKGETLWAGKPDKRTENKDISFCFFTDIVLQGGLF